MRTPSMTPAEAEAELGPRGRLTAVTPDNRPTVRKWLTAKGYSALFVAALSKYELLAAYNSDKGLEAIDKKYRDAQAIMADEDRSSAAAASAGEDMPAQPPRHAPQDVTGAFSPAPDAPTTLTCLKGLLSVSAKVDTDEIGNRPLTQSTVHMGAPVPSTKFHRTNRSSRARMLTKIREAVGDKLFADYLIAFLIDAPTGSLADFPAFVIHKLMGDKPLPTSISEAPMHGPDKDEM